MEAHTGRPTRSVQDSVSAYVPVPSPCPRVHAGKSRCLILSPRRIIFGCVYIQDIFICLEKPLVNADSGIYAALGMQSMERSYITRSLINAGQQRTVGS